jgi:biopolymer transport protein ExbD
MHLNKQRTGMPPISLVSMVDVLMIMLVFFMVTSTYLNLRMIPLSGAEDQTATPRPPKNPENNLLQSPLILRLGPDGRISRWNQYFDHATLQTFLRSELRVAPNRAVLVLPSGRAPMQSLVSLLDTLAESDAREVRVIRVGATP